MLAFIRYTARPTRAATPAAEPTAMPAMAPLPSPEPPLPPDGGLKAEAATGTAATAVALIAAGRAAAGAAAGEAAAGAGVGPGLLLLLLLLAEAAGTDCGQGQWGWAACVEQAEGTALGQPMADQAHLPQHTCHTSPTPSCAFTHAHLQGGHVHSSARLALEPLFHLTGGHRVLSPGGGGGGGARQEVVQGCKGARVGAPETNAQDQCPAANWKLTWIH